MSMGVNRTRPRSLVAGTPEALETLRKLLGEDLDLVWARSVEEALRLVDSDIDLVICNVRFDESRMFDFLHEMQKRPSIGKAPIICCRISPEPIPLASRHAIELALDALGVGVFIDLAQMRSDFSETADSMFRAMVLARLNFVASANNRRI